MTGSVRTTQKSRKQCACQCACRDNSLIINELHVRKSRKTEFLCKRKQKARARNIVLQLFDFCVPSFLYWVRERCGTHTGAHSVFSTFASCVPTICPVVLTFACPLLFAVKRKKPPSGDLAGPIGPGHLERLVGLIHGPKS